MKKHDLKAEIREQQRFQRLGTDRPICGVCGETDSRCFENHHLSGRKYDPTTAPFCLNCHRKLSDMGRDHPAQIGDPPSLIERVAHLLLGLADLFAIVIDLLRQYAYQLLDLVQPQIETGEPS